MPDITLRNYQSDILSRTKKSFKYRHKRPLVVAPCGSGKTAMFASMAQSAQARGRTVWFLVHRKELLDQTIETFERFSILRETIHIGMVATVANHPERLPEPYFIVFDEGHHASAATWKKIIAAYPDAFVVGLTATPCRLDGKPLGEIYDDLIVGITAQELIQQGYLSNYKYYAPAVVDLSGLKRKGRDYDPEQAAQLLSERAVFGDVIKHYREHADGLQAICYCTTIKHSQAMAEQFRAAGINAVHFDGETKKQERTEIIKKYRAGEIQILCNCELISEGLDISGVHCCMLLRPTMSLSLFIQMSMRCLRPEQGKVAIILDFVNNVIRHGLPSDDREWSLSEAVKLRKEYSEDGLLSIVQCKQCFYTFKRASVCPNCGAEIRKTREEIKNIKDIRLKEIMQTRRDKAAEAVEDKGSIHDCKTLFEIMAWCKRNGKKTGYGYYVAKARGLI